MGVKTFFGLFKQLNKERELDLESWKLVLRWAGFKAAHPNDGWVDREKKEIFLAYPHYNDGAEVGDPVMLGQPWRREDWRPIRLIEKRVTLFNMTMWRFEDISPKEKRRCLELMKP